LGSFGVGFFEEENSEKGCSRKHTGNWVTRWIFCFRGNLEVLRCFTKRILLGEFEIGTFWGFERGSTWGSGGGGALVCFFCAFEGSFSVLVGWGFVSSFNT
jgi:hypothetical protein